MLNLRDAVLSSISGRNPLNEHFFDVAVLEVVDTCWLYPLLSTSS